VRVSALATGLTAVSSRAGATASGTGSRRHPPAVNPPLRLFGDARTQRCRRRSWATVGDDREEVMGAISIRCPTTGKPVDTGMSMEAESFHRSVLTGNSVRCPHCGAQHIWSKREAIIDDGQSPH
jgi:endogenous inhibitor of DNA gyrase (YacG/DUF329 family)